LEGRAAETDVVLSAVDTHIAAAEAQMQELAERLAAIEDRVASLEQVPRSPAIYDATGAFVGPIVDLMSPGEAGSGERGEQVTIVLHVADRSVFLQVVPLGFLADQGNSVYFADSDCTGQAFIGSKAPLDEGRLLAPVVVSPYYLGTVYAAAPEALPQAAQVRSYVSGIGTPICVNRDFVQEAVAPATPLLDLRTRFTPPFSVR
jgi:hypothetical protein